MIEWCDSIIPTSHSYTLPNFKDFVYGCQQLINNEYLVFVVETRSETVFRFKTNHDDGPLNYDVI